MGCTKNAVEYTCTKSYIHVYKCTIISSSIKEGELENYVKKSFDCKLKSFIIHIP